MFPLNPCQSQWSVSSPPRWQSPSQRRPNPSQVWFHEGRRRLRFTSSRLSISSCCADPQICQSLGQRSPSLERVTSDTTQFTVHYSKLHLTRLRDLFSPQLVQQLSASSSCPSNGLRTTQLRFFNFRGAFEYILCASFTLWGNGKKKHLCTLLLRLLLSI